MSTVAETPETQTLEVTVTPKAIEKIRQTFRKKRWARRRWTASRGTRWRLFGPQLPVQVRHRASLKRQDLQLRRRADFRRSEKPDLPARHDARLQRVAHAVGLRLRKSQRQKELRLRHVFFGVTFFEILELPTALSLDAADLDKRFYALSRKYHPDLYSRRPAAEQQEALDRSALLNDAYRTLEKTRSGERSTC